jgi:DNA-binding MarR family transcriptional regulator
MASPESLEKLFESLDDFLPYFYREINPIIHSYECEEFTLNENQIKVMMAVCRKEGISPTEVSRLFMIPKTSLTTIVRSLTELDLVEKMNRPSDPRRFGLKLSPQGKDTVGKIRKKNAGGLRELFRDMEEAHVSRLISGFAVLEEFYRAQGRGI